MDPTAAREALIRITARIESAMSDGVQPRAEDVDALVGAVRALDGWLCAGGFLPSPWARPERR